MRKSMPIGAYVAGETPLHGLDARAKLVALVAVSVGAFVARSPLALVLLAAALVVLLAVARMGAGTIARALRPTVVALAFAILANTLVVDGSYDLQIVGFVGINLGGFGRAAMAVGRIALLVGFVCVVTATTSATEVASALVAGLRPLARLGMPVGDVAMVVGMALRFIPETMGEFDRIEMAQRARGTRFDQGSVRERVGKWIAVLIPLVVALFARADELALAMRDRCYSGAGGVMPPRPAKPRDVLFVLFAVALAIVCVLV